MRVTTKTRLQALKSQLETSVPKTGESGASRRARMELKVGKAVAKEDAAYGRVNRTPWKLSEQSYRDAGLAAHDSKDAKMASKGTAATRRASIGDAPEIGEKELAGMRDKYRKHAEQAASLRLRPMSFENWMKARKGD